MYARVAIFEGDTDQLEQGIGAAKARVEDNWESPPEGLEGAKEMWMLVDRESGRGLGITVYETEEDLRRGDEALNAMPAPDPDASGRRASVGFYEVALRKQRD